jgi:hypothetical protein
VQINFNLRTVVLASAALLALGAGAAWAANKYGKPKTIIHVVTLSYKEGTTDAQKKQVLDGVEKMASEIPGIRNVWLKAAKVQGYQYEKLANGSTEYRRMTDAFVMEFESDAAMAAYAEHPAHAAWEKIYVPLRHRSATSDVTNP